VNPTLISTLCKTGPADLRITDNGYFGAGIYSTLQAEYARGYATGELTSSIPPNERGEHTLLLCWIAVGNVYPITRQLDYTHNSNYSNFYENPCGIALKAGFDAHFACVSPVDSYQATTNLNDPNVLHELVVKDQAQVLPRFILYFKN